MVLPEITYAGHQYDDVLNLFYAKARMYDAENRRFMAVDPVKGQITESMSFVSYLYCVDNPLRWVDPLGNRYEKDGGDLHPQTPYVESGKLNPDGELPGTESILRENLTSYVLVQGSQGSAVRTLQKLLISYGYLPAGEDDGIFGSATKAAVIGFQRDFGLLVDGKVGPNTWGKLLSGSAVQEGKRPAADISQISQDVEDTAAKMGGDVESIVARFAPYISDMATGRVENYFHTVLCKEQGSSRVYGIALGASAAWGIALEGIIMLVWDELENYGLAVTGGFGGGLGASVITGESILDFLLGAGIQFSDSVKTIWDIEGPSVSIGVTLGIVNFEASMGGGGPQDVSTSVGFNRKGLEFHAVISGTKLLATW